MALSPRIARLLARLEQPERLILGLMSGTSLDGLDLALCRFSGHGEATAVELLHSTTVPYSAPEQARLRAVVFQRQALLEEVALLNRWLAEHHAAAVTRALADWGVAAEAVACLASHGQTVFHAPGSRRGGGPPSNATLQLGDGDLLAVRTGIPTLADFRQKEIAGGGQGAPLAPYAEALLFGNAARARVMVNLGGIANFSWLPAAGEGHPVVFGDTGPANTLLDLAVRRWFPAAAGGFDRDGRLSAGGRANGELLRIFLDHPFFALPCPKSTGPEMFGADFLDRALATAAHQGVPTPAPADLLATLAALTAQSLAATLAREVPDWQKAECYLSGGGRHNPTLMASLADALPGVSLRDSSDLGIPPDAKEAVLFATLANETLWGSGFSVGWQPGAAKIGFGKLSFPD